MPKPTQLLLASAIAVLAASTTAQTWTRKITGAWTYYTPVAVHENGFDLAFRNGSNSVHVSLTPQGTVSSPFQLQGMSGLLNFRHLADLGGGRQLLSGVQNNRCWIGAVDRATGLTIWDETVSDEQSSFFASCRNAHGHVIVVGSRVDPVTSITRQFICAIDPNGGVLWRRSYGASILNESGVGIHPLHGGGLVMVNFSSAPSATVATLRTVWLDDLGNVIASRHMSMTPGGLRSPVAAPSWAPRGPRTSSRSATMQRTTSFGSGPTTPTRSTRRSTR